MSLTTPLRTTLCHNCSLTYLRLSLPKNKRLPFHTTAPLRHDLSTTLPNHYETLNLPPTASVAEIKKQFYALSKQHHPDLNPNNPSSSQKFVAISEAYHILGSAEKRAKYDRDYERAHAPSPVHRRGSHSSYSGGPAGARPASGLSSRRTQFRGPPPSFYRAGGYGMHGAKRQQAQQDSFGSDSGNNSTASSSRPGGLGSKPTAEKSGGYGLGQGEESFEPDIPYWDKRSHFRTHDKLRQRRERQAGESGMSGMEEHNIGGSLIFNFFVVCGVVAIAVAVPTWWTGSSHRKDKKENG